MNLWQTEPNESTSLVIVPSKHQLGGYYDESDWSLPRDQSEWREEDHARMPPSKAKRSANRWLFSVVRCAIFNQTNNHQEIFFSPSRVVQFDFLSLVERPQRWWWELEAEDCSCFPVTMHGKVISFETDNRTSENFESSRTWWWW